MQNWYFELFHELNNSKTRELWEEYIYNLVLLSLFQVAGFPDASIQEEEVTSAQACAQRNTSMNGSDDVQQGSARSAEDEGEADCLFSEYLDLSSWYLYQFWFL